MLDVALMREIGRGDRAALADLYDRYAPTLLALARRMLEDPDEAEDLLQAVFVEVMHTAQRYDPRRGTVRAWLITKTRSRALDRIRARQKRHRLQLVTTSGERSLELSEKLGVRMGLDHLPEQMRTVLALMYFEGRTASEIADRLEVPLGTVKSRLSRATAKLRGLLAER